MSKRLWDKGEPLDQRVLRYTAGEDHILDERLVPYDVRASIAHATMLHEQSLLSHHLIQYLRQLLSEWSHHTHWYWRYWRP